MQQIVSMQETVWYDKTCPIDNEEEMLHGAA